MFTAGISVYQTTVRLVIKYLILEKETIIKNIISTETVKLFHVSLGLV